MMVENGISHVKCEIVGRKQSTEIKKEIKDNDVKKISNMETIMSSLARKRRTSGVFGSKRWWTPNCWSSRNHQETYLRKLYSKKFSRACTDCDMTISKINTDDSPNSTLQKETTLYEVPTTNEDCYLNAFLRTKIQYTYPILSTSGTSPNEKCVEFLSRNKLRHLVLSEQQEKQEQQKQYSSILTQVDAQNFDDVNTSNNSRILDVDIYPNFLEFARSQQEELQYIDQNYVTNTSKQIILTKNPCSSSNGTSPAQPFDEQVQLGNFPSERLRFLSEESDSIPLVVQDMFVQQHHHQRQSQSDNDSGCALEEYTWVPPGLKLDQVHLYFSNLQEDQIPYIGTTGERYRLKQFLYQLPPQDNDARFCRELNEQEMCELLVFFRRQKQEAMGRGQVRQVEGAHENNCRECRRLISQGEIVVGAGRIGYTALWHPACFICCICRQLLVDLIYFLKDDRLYCGRHHAETLKPRCCACDEIIFADECTEAEGRAWHMRHFTCVECNIQLGGHRYVMKKSRAYCLHCFDVSFAEYCGSCGEPIGVDQGQMYHDSQYWHADENCFCCVICHTSLLGKPFLPYGGVLYCSVECSKGELLSVLTDSSIRATPTPKSFLRISKKHVKYINDASTASFQILASCSKSPSISRKLQQLPTSYKEQQKLILLSDTPIQEPSLHISAVRNTVIKSDMHSYCEGFDCITVDQKLENVLQERDKQITGPSTELVRVMDVYDEEIIGNSINAVNSLISKNMLKIANYKSNDIHKISDYDESLELDANKSLTFVPNSPKTYNVGNNCHQNSSISSVPYTLHKENSSPLHHVPLSQYGGIVSNSRRVRFQGDDQIEHGSRTNDRCSPSLPYRLTHHTMLKSHVSKSDDISGSSLSSTVDPKLQIDDEETCSTCSSSSSSDDADIYILPPRRAYGGVRLAYIPNDAIACARRRMICSSVGVEATSKDDDKCIIS